jgi:hypothetical protein
VRFRDGRDASLAEGTIAGATISTSEESANGKAACPEPATSSVVAADTTAVDREDNGLDVDAVVYTDLETGMGNRYAAGNERLPAPLQPSGAGCSDGNATSPEDDSDVIDGAGRGARARCTIDCSCG